MLWLFDIGVGMPGRLCCLSNLNSSDCEGQAMGIRNLRLWVLATLLALFCPRFALAEAPFGLTKNDPGDPAERAAVGLVGDPRKVRIDGSLAFHADQITSALATDLTYQAAARPSSDLLDLIEVLEQRVDAGYRHAGYLDANVIGSYDSAAGAPAAAVVEGPRYLAGKVRVEGATAIDASELAARLQKPVPARTWTYVRGSRGPLKTPSDKPASPRWKTGEPAPGDEQTLEAIADQVKIHLADLGFPFARVKVRIERSDDKKTADLVVAIDAEGPAAVIHDVQINGLTRHARQEILDFLKIGPGTPANFDACEHAYQALRRSCRFWKYDVVARLSDQPDDRYRVNPDQVDLEITVLEYDRVPPLGEPLSDVDQCLVRTAEWLDKFQLGEVDDEIVYEGVAPFVAEDLEPAKLRLVLSPRQGVAATLSGEQPGKFRFDHACILGRERQEIDDWVSGKKLSAAEPLNVQLSLKVSCGEIEDGEPRISILFGHGVSFKPQTTDSQPAGSLWSVTTEPVALVHTAHRKGMRTALKDGVLVAANESMEITVDQQSGRPIQLRFFNENQRDQQHAISEIRTARGEFDRLHDEVTQRGEALIAVADEDQSLAATKFAIDSALAQPCVGEMPLANLACRQLELLLSPRGKEILALESIKLWTGTDSNHEKSDRFAIPAAPIKFEGEAHWTMLIHAGPLVADLMFPRASWPWTWTREWAFVAADNWRKGEFAGNFTDSGYYIEYHRAMQEASPFGRWVMVKFSPSLWNDEVAAEVVRIILNWPEKDFSAELKTLLHGEHGLAKLSAAVVNVVVELDAARRETALDSLGTQGRKVFSQLLERRSAHPDEPPTDSLEVVLLEVWNSGGRAAIFESLRTVAKEPQELPPTANTQAGRSDTAAGQTQARRNEPAETVD